MRFIKTIIFDKGVNIEGSPNKLICKIFTPDDGIQRIFIQQRVLLNEPINELNWSLIKKFKGLYLYEHIFIMSSYSFNKITNKSIEYNLTGNVKTTSFNDSKSICIELGLNSLVLLPGANK